MLYKSLEKYKSFNNWRLSSDYRFYQQHKSLFDNNPYFIKYSNVTNELELINSVIILKILNNKRQIETGYELYKTINKEIPLDIKKFMTDIKKDLSFIERNSTKIYIPIFDDLTNVMYNEKIEEIDDYPYNNFKDNYLVNVVNPFVEYYPLIYDSHFTKLIAISHDKTSTAFYHYDFDCIYIFNSQGRLDCTIRLFDKFIIHKDKFNMIERLKKVVDNYYNLNLSRLVLELYNNRFISLKFYNKIAKYIKGK